MKEPITIATFKIGNREIRMEWHPMSLDEKIVWAFFFTIATMLILGY